MKKTFFLIICLFIVRASIAQIFGACIIDSVPPSLQPLVSNDITSKIDIIAICSDDATYAKFRIVNRNDFNISIAYLAPGFSGTITINDSSSQEISVSKYSICSFYHNGAIFNQIGTNNHYCSDPSDVKYNISAYSIGTISNNWSIYSITNKNDFEVTIDANAGINSYPITLPADTVTEIIIPNSDLELVYNEETFLVHNASPCTWNASDFFSANIVDHSTNTITIELKNNTTLPYTLVLHNTLTSDHIYHLAAHETRNVEVEKISWDVYLNRYALLSDGYPSYNNNFYLFSVNLFNIATSVNPVNAGTVSGAGAYSNGENVTLTATANAGYAFKNWTENGSTVSTNATYTFTANANRTIVANFSIVPVSDMLTFSTNHIGVQTRYPSTNVYDLGNIGSTDALTSLYIKVIDDNIETSNRYVMYNGSELGQLNFQGNSSWIFMPTAPFNWSVGLNTMTTQFADYDGNLLNITVNFTLVQEYSISAIVNPINSGTISGTGIYNKDSTIILTATSNPGYSFSDWTENGITVSTDSIFSFIASSNRNLVANFDFTSGIKNLFESNSIVIYPNPTKGKLIVNNEKLKVKNIIVTDITDKIIQSFSNSQFSEFSNFEMDISTYEQGIYLLKLETEIGVFVKKIIKQ